MKRKRDSIFQCPSCKSGLNALYRYDGTYKFTKMKVCAKCGIVYKVSINYEIVGNQK